MSNELKKAAKERQMLLQLLERDFKLSVFRVLLQITEK